MRFTAKLVLFLAATLLVSGCSKTDPTLDAAPPPGPNAHPLPAHAGKVLPKPGGSATPAPAPSAGTL